MKKKLIQAVAFSVALCATSVAFAQSNADYMFSGKKHPSYDSKYESIDSYVKGLSIPVSMSYADAAKKICAKSNTDIQKARAIFTWVASNIQYDVTFNRDTAYNAKGTWDKRCGVCQGYALLYNELANAAGLKTEYVSGFSKSYMYEFGDDAGSHGWSLVHLSDRDMLVDSCWGAGNVNGNKFTFDFKDYWFDVDPNIMIATHFPRVSSYQALKTPATVNRFETLPYVQPSLNFGGIEGVELLEFYRTHNKAWCPLIYGGFDEVAKAGLVINKMPMAKTLKQGESYTVNMKVPSGYSLVFYVDGKRVPVTSGADITIKPTTTQEVTLFGNNKGMFQYQVSNSPTFDYEEVAAADSGIITTTTCNGTTCTATVTDAPDPGKSTEVTDVPDDYVTPLRFPARLKTPIQTSKGFKNKKGLVFDPYAKVDFSKDGTIVGNVKISFNKAGNQINFIDKNNKKLLYGTFLYKEQYWKKYDKKLDALNLDMEKFYSSINLYQTDLWRDAKGECVGPKCNVQDVTVTSAQVESDSKKSDKEGLNMDNIAGSILSFTTTDGRRVNTEANGKGKVVIFFKNRCGNCMATSRDLKNMGGNIGNADLVEIEISKASKADVTTFKSTYGCDSVPFAYDTTDNGYGSSTASSMMWNYVRKVSSSGSVTLPVIVYIDANNKIQFVESGYQKGEHIKSIVTDYFSK